MIWKKEKEVEPKTKEPEEQELDKNDLDNVSGGLRNFPVDGNIPISGDTKDKI